MSTQNFKNHIRFYPPHHFVFYPVVLGLLITAINYAMNDTKNQAVWLFMSALLFIIGALAFMLRQHYALVLQDRIIRSELRYRYFVTTGKRFEPLETLLNDSQLFALRFAPDAELDALSQRALKENLSGTAIKKAIQQWNPDHHRV